MTLDAKDTFTTAHFVASLNHITATRDGQRLDEVLCSIWRIEDGLVVEIFTHISDLETFHGFWHEVG